MLVRSTYPFYLEPGGHIYEVGEVVDVTSEHAERLFGLGVAVADGEGGSNGEPDVAVPVSGDMTVAQLREVAESRGIDVPKRATKAQLLEILGA